MHLYFDQLYLLKKEKTREQKLKDAGGILQQVGTRNATSIPHNYVF